MKGYVNLTHTNNSAIEEVSQKIDEIQDDYVTKDTTELTNYYTKSQTYTKEEVDNKTTNVYRAKGSVQTYQDLPTENNQVGDVYNVIEAYEDYPAGTNFVWTDTSTWDALGGEISIIQGVSQEDFDNLVNNEIQIKSSKNNFMAGGSLANNNGNYNVAIGHQTHLGINDSSVVIGRNSSSTMQSSVAIGHSASVHGSGSFGIQLGQGINSTPNSFQVNGDNIYKSNTHTLTVQNAEINGTPAYGVLSGTSAPTTTTVGAVGQFYLDTTNKQLYQCMSITQESVDEVDTNVYEWEKVDNGTTVNVNNIAQSTLNFTSDPQTQLNNKVDKVQGKGLSTNDFTNEDKTNLEENSQARHTHTNKSILDSTTANFTTQEKTKLSGIEVGAEVNNPIDSTLSTTSENAVQNKVVTEALNNKTTVNISSVTQNTINFTSDPQTQLNEKLDKSGGEVSGDVTINNGNGIVLEPSSAGQTYNAFKFYAQGDDVYVEKQKVEGGADYQKILPLDSELSLTSSNAVQNNVVTEALNDKASLSQNNTFTGNQSFTGDVNIKSLKQSDDLVWGTLYGNGAPTTTTVGAVGQLYIDITNDKMYVCVQFDFPNYVWKEVAFVDNAKLLNKIYPIGSIYISVNQTSPASFIGGTWQALDEGRTLWTTTTAGQGGTTVSAGLPNIEGSLESVVMAKTYDNQPYSTGALSFGNNVVSISGAGNGWWTYLKPLYFNANDDNDIYGNSTTVQPPAYRVYMWKRTA